MRSMLPKPHELYCGALRAQGPNTKPLTLTLTLNLMRFMLPKPHELYCWAQRAQGVQH
jgi:hypothetical protein